MGNSQHARGGSCGATAPSFPRARRLNLDPARLRPRVSTLNCLMLLVLGACRGYTQEFQPAQPATFLRAHDRFGFDLLRSTHEDSRNRNIVISPLPISLAFAVLFDGGADSES